MSDACRNYRGAAAEGSGLCRLGAIPEPGTRGVSAGVPVLPARSGEMLRAYANACPHQSQPLDRKGDGLLGANGAVLRCTNHSAGFRLDDGEGMEGFGPACALDAIPVASIPLAWSSPRARVPVRLRSGNCSSVSRGEKTDDNP